MTATTRDIRNTLQLAPGDVVVTHGMRILIDGELHVWHTQNGTREVRTYRNCTVLTPVDEIRDGRVVPVSWLHHETPDRPTWTIQGNDLATWAVEVTS